MTRHRIALLGLIAFVSVPVVLSAQSAFSRAPSTSVCGLDCMDGLAICSGLSYISSGSSFHGAVDEPYCAFLEGGCEQLSRCGEDLRGVVDSAEAAARRADIARLSRLAQTVRPGAVRLAASHVEVRDCSDRLVARFPLVDARLAALTAQGRGAGAAIAAGPSLDSAPSLSWAATSPPPHSVRAQ